MTIVSPVAFLLALCIFGLVLQLTGMEYGEYNPNHPKFQEAIEAKW